MTDNELFRLIISILETGLVARGQSGVTVQQTGQPEQQGVPIGPTVLLTKVADRRAGFVQQSDVYDTVNRKMIHTERQYMESTFQMGALYPQNPKKTTLTASDLVNLCSSIMQSNATISQLGELGMGVLRMTDSRNPYFTDDKDRFEANPSIDFTLTHEQVYTNEIPVVDSFKLKIASV